MARLGYTAQKRAGARLSCTRAGYYTLWSALQCASRSYAARTGAASMAAPQWAAVALCCLVLAAGAAAQTCTAGRSRAVVMQTGALKLHGACERCCMRLGPLLARSRVLLAAGAAGCLRRGQIVRSTHACLPGLSPRCAAAGYIKIDLISSSPVEDPMALCGTSLQINIAADCKVRSKRGAPNFLSVAAATAPTCGSRQSVCLQVAYCMLSSSSIVWLLPCPCPQLPARTCAAGVAHPAQL